MRFNSLAIIFTTLASFSRASELTPSLLKQVYQVMQDISVYSWENGTMAEAMLEWTYPTYSVFTTTGNPFPQSLSGNSIEQVNDVAKITLQNRPPSNGSAIMGGSTLLQDGAAGDPASLGVAVMLANASEGNNAQINGIGYGSAATSELNYLLYNVPRYSNGAISHRADQVQLWSDNVFMSPPFLAYYGAMTNNQSLIQEAYNQISEYRDVLVQPSGLWSHIALGVGNIDPGLWATGNAWAVYGMLRVYATMAKSSFAGYFGGQMSDLSTWMGEIMGNCQELISDEGLFHNYLDQTETFLDSASSALIAAAGLRMSLLNITDSYVPMSLTLLSAVSDNVNSSGYLTQVVDPLDFPNQGTTSPEGQSFVIMAYAAYDSWKKAGEQGGNGTSSPLGPSSGAVMDVQLSHGVVATAVLVGLMGVFGNLL